MATAIMKYEMLATDRTIERLYSGVNVLNSDACWNWQYAKVPDGYGILTRKINKKVFVILVHRLSYYLSYGEIPNGMVIDHLCHNDEIDDCPSGTVCKHRSCINPKHLRVLTIKENLALAKKDGRSQRFRREKRGTCRKGHPWIEENMVTRKSGRVDCAICRKIHNAVTNKKAVI